MRSLQNCSTNGRMIKRSIWNFFDIYLSSPSFKSIEANSKIDRLRIKMEIRQYIDKSVIDWKWKNSSSIIDNHSTRRNWNEKIDSKNYGKIDLNNRFLVLSSHFILNIFEYINIHLWVWIELHTNLYSHHTNSYGFQKLKEIEKIRTSLKVWKNVSNFAW